MSNLLCIICEHADAVEMIKMVDLLVSCWQSKGGRRSMEDFVAVFNGESGRRMSHTIVGVYDGHGGHEASKYTGEQMFSAIHDNPKFGMGHQDNQVLLEAFATINRKLLELRCKLYISFICHSYSDTKPRHACR